MKVPKRYLVIPHFVFDIALRVFYIIQRFLYHKIDTELEYLCFQFHYLPIYNWCVRTDRRRRRFRRKVGCYSLACALKWLLCGSVYTQKYIASLLWVGDSLSSYQVVRQNFEFEVQTTVASIQLTYSFYKLLAIMNWPTIYLHPNPKIKKFHQERMYSAVSET
jgi:hypothetical protein